MNRHHILYNNFLNVPLKALKRPLKNSPSLCKSKVYPLPPIVFFRSKAETTAIKPVSTILPVSPVVEQTGKVPCFLEWQGGGEKMAVSLSPWQAADRFSSGLGSFPAHVTQRRNNFSPGRGGGL
jgi:hypothetical protein